MVEQNKGRPGPVEMKAADVVEQYCIACGDICSHRLEPLSIVPDDPSYADHHIAACTICGLRSAYPMPDREQLRMWYSDGRAVDWNEKTGPRAVWRRTHDRYMVGLVARFVPSGLLVDVGAGSGRFIRAARELGRWSIVATELAEVAVETLKHDGFDARLGNIDEAGLADHSVDVVWVSHVLEHVPDIQQFLASVRRMLKTGGYFAVLLPSEESLRARLRTSTWHFVNPPGHLWGFRRATIRKVLERNGFSVELTREIHVVCEMVCIARAN